MRLDYDLAFERGVMALVVLAWIVSIVNPMVGSIFVVVGLFRDRKRRAHYSLLLALLFASFAYWFIPNHEMDLTRYFFQLSQYRLLDWNQFTHSVLTKNILVIQEILFYIIAQSGNFHLLPAIVIFVTYSILFYTIADFCNRHDVSTKGFIEAVLFSLCVLPFPLLVSNVRNILAFAIFVFGVYRELEQKKRNIVTLICYIIPLFIHISALAMLFLRLLVGIYCKNGKLQVVVSIAILSAPALIATIGKQTNGLVFSSSNIGIVSAFLKKAYNYATTTDTAYAIYLQTSVVARLQKVYFSGIAALLLVSGIMIMLGLSKYREPRNRTEMIGKGMLGFHNMLCLVVLATTPIRLTVYMRFAFPTIIVSFLVVCMRERFIIRKIYRQILSLCLFAGSLVGLVHQIAFTSKMTNISNMFVSVMTRTLLNMFVQ